MEDYTHGFSYWSNGDEHTGSTSVTPPLFTNVKRMPRFYVNLYDARPVFTVEDSVIQNLTIYLHFLEKKMKEAEVPNNSVTEQEALDQLREFLKPRIEKTRALLELIR